MKKLLLGIFAAVMLLAAVGCRKNVIGINNVQQYCNRAAEAVSITQTIEQRDGDTIINFKKTTYTVLADGSVSVAVETRTLNDDFLAAEQYVVENSEFTLSAEDAKSGLPTKITLDSTMFDGEFTIADGVFSFNVASASVADFLKLAAEQAQGISDLSVQISFSAERVTQVLITYKGANNFTQSIRTAFTYAAQEAL